MNNEEVRGEAPNSDISHVKEHLKKVLIFFDNCENILQDVALIPVIGELLRKIREQGSEFHTCVQKSIAQSYNLESHAEDVIKFLEAEDLNLDSNGFRILFENTRQNTEVTKEIKEKYDSIKNELVEVDRGFYTTEENNKEELRSLKEKRDDLEEQSNTVLVVVSSIAGFIPLILLSGKRDFSEDDFFLGVFIAIAMIVFSVKTNFDFIRNPKTEIRKINGKISKLEHDEESIRSSKERFRELKGVCNNLIPIVREMGYYNVYWDMQYNRLGELNRKYNDISDQNRKLLVEATKSGWEEIKKSTNNYIKTVRNVVTEVHKSQNIKNEEVHENNNVENENA